MAKERIVAPGLVRAATELVREQGAEEARKAFKDALALDMIRVFTDVASIVKGCEHRKQPEIGSIGKKSFLSTIQTGWIDVMVGTDTWEYALRNQLPIIHTMERSEGVERQVDERGEQFELIGRRENTSEIYVFNRFHRYGLQDRKGKELETRADITEVANCIKFMRDDLDSRKSQE